VLGIDRIIRGRFAAGSATAHGEPWCSRVPGSRRSRRWSRIGQHGAQPSGVRLLPGRTNRA
jgi:hypothetical protein